MKQQEDLIDVKNITIEKTVTKDSIKDVKQSIEDKCFEEKKNDVFPRRSCIEEKHNFFDVTVETIYELQDLVFDKYKEQRYIGHRKNIQGKLSGYIWETYSDIRQKGEMFVKGLSLLSLGEQECLGFLSKGSPEVVVAEYACHRRNIVIIHLYEQFTSFEIKHIMNETEMKVIFCEKRLLNKLHGISSELPYLKNIIVVDNQDSEKTDLIFESINVYTYDQILNAEQEKNFLLEKKPTPEDICYISYTSGTGGLSKGVIVKHKNFIGALLNVQSAIKNRLVYTNGKEKKTMKQLGDISIGDVHLSYLPLSHIMERLIFMSVSTNGAGIGFSQGNRLKLLDDIKALKPTIFIAIPRVMNKLCEEIKKSVENSNWFVKKIFDYAMETKIKAIKETGEYSNWFFDYFVFSKVKEAFGGKIRLILSGSAPLSPYVSKFIKTCFSCDVFEGYGQTETMGTISVSLKKDTVFGHVGSPFPLTRVKLVDVPEMDFTNADKPFSRGEICVKGQNCFDGYYKNEELTKEVIKDGWVFTGDIGMWDADGRLWIIDRKKSIFKISQGEYISPEKIEMVLSTLPAIQQCFIDGNSMESFIVSIVVPNRDYVENWAKRNNLHDDYTNLCLDKKLREHILDLIETKGKKGTGELNSLELPKKVFIEPEPFSIEQGLVTTTLKPKRLNIKKKYKRIIEEFYKKN